MNDLKELNEISAENANEALKETTEIDITEILKNETFNGSHSFFIDEKYINSADFRRKFDKLSDNPALNEAIYQAAKEALKHRNGTPYEDMYLFDTRTGKVMAKQTDSAIERKILRTIELENALKSRNKAMLHTHPAGMPPSARDFNTAYDYGFGTCYIVGHNGRIFKYASYEEIDEELFDLCVKLYIGQGYSDFIAQILTIQEFMVDHNIKLGEAT